VTDKFFPLPLPELLKLTLSMIRQNRFFGIPGSLFFRPGDVDPFRIERYGQALETPLGLAAGPHTQLAINIIAGWLCGARYIELKTVQTLDELEISKPCIDMQDEGYNCEWSQELKIEKSFDEYLNAWILIHILKKELGFKGPVGTIFNMSVGYNLEGILKKNVQDFFSRMQDCSAGLKEKINSIRKIYPSIDEIEIPSCISDNITLSTMHGCPPDEIERIGLYLINEKNLHTTIKLNPTLLGKDNVRNILREGGFSAEIPDIAFEHDLKYPDSLRIIRSLQKASDERNLKFGIKLTNTLESVNNRNIFPAKETMMYMSGRALHPISVKVAQKISNDLEGNVDISFSAGADCFNVTEILACGIRPVTVCSDLLKPGGYGRLWQYIENIRTSFEEAGSKNFDEFILNKSHEKKSLREAALHSLNEYASQVATDPAYRKKTFVDPDIKTSRNLEFFDCIHAPCTDTCPTNQDIPSYMHSTSNGDIASAFAAIFDTNPFPSVTGMVCDHPCQLKCTRINYDDALHIREIKRFVAENSNGKNLPVMKKSNGFKAAIIGAGPAGLSCAWYLNLAGFEVHVYEQKEKTGGMVSSAIPSFRLRESEIDRDVDRIVDSGIEIHRNTIVDNDNFLSIRNSSDIVFIAAGAQRSSKLKIEGIDTGGVLDPLGFLFSIREGLPVAAGNNIVIIGGGNTAMDAARTAFRVTGRTGKVTVLYRRTLKEMPADKGEIQAVLDEGIEVLELVNPEQVISREGQAGSLICSRNRLSEAGEDGRRRPMKIEGSEFELRCDTIIPAIGQELAIDFIDAAELKTSKGSYRTNLKKIYIGGDSLRGASTAINAIADGRKAAQEIMSEFHNIRDPKSEILKKVDISQLLHLKAVRSKGISPSETSPDDRKNFNLVISSYAEHEATKEAKRCLQCDEICNVCVSVCPNLANFSYTIEPVSYNLQTAFFDKDGIVRLEEDEPFIVSQPYQVLNIRDHCNECGNCTTFCPTSGKPYRDKPGLCLSEEAFASEEKGYHLKKYQDKNFLLFKNGANTEILRLEKDHYIYETKHMKAEIAADSFRITDVKLLSEEKNIRFRHAAVMAVILKGATELVKTI
jgi:putative selenate reductase